jgi:hypothetical protein
MLTGKLCIYPLVKYEGLHQNAWTASIELDPFADVSLSHYLLVYFEVLLV